MSISKIQHTTTEIGKPPCFDEAMHPIALGRGPGTSIATGSGVKSGWTVEVDKLMDVAFPLDNVLDGNPDTFAWPAAEDRATMEIATYTFRFDTPQQADSVRFLQHRTAFAYAYRLLGSADGIHFDQVLVDRSTPDPTIPAGEWICHTFPQGRFQAVRFQPLGGVTAYPLYKDLCAPPALAGFDLGFGEAASTPPAPPEDTIRIDVGAILDVNGHDRIRDTMFAVSNIPADPEFAAKYLKPLNLGMVTLWPSTLAHVPTDNDGHPVASYFASGQGYEKDGRWEAGVCAIARDILGCPVSLRLEKAPPAMRLTGFATTNLHRDRTGAVETQFDPPASPSAWAEMAALAVNSLNRRHPGSVRFVELWNEPNTTRYWPMPIPEKASSYRRFFAEAAAVLRQRCPGVGIDGPVTSGGVLGWAGLPKEHDLAFVPHWEQWVKGMVEDAGPLIAQFNVHPYGFDADCHRAEARLLANYATNMIGHVIPLSSSEANAATVFARPGTDHTVIAWRKNVVGWADFLLPLLMEPDKFASLTYFYITIGNAHDPWGMFNGLSSAAETDETFSAHHPYMFATKEGRPKGPQPIYFFYRMLAALRGHLLPLEGENRNRWNVVATRQGSTLTVAIQNRTAHAARLTLPICLPEGVQIASASRERLEYDAHVAAVVLDGGPLPFSNDTLTVDVSAFGIQVLSIHLDADTFESRRIRIVTAYGDRVWQTLSPEDPEGVIHVAHPVLAAPEKITEAKLCFGLAGVPFQRPHKIFHRPVPLEVLVNGVSKGVVDAGTFNTIPLELSELRHDNTVLFRLLDNPSAPDPRKSPRSIHLLSAEVEVRLA